MTSRAAALYRGRGVVEGKLGDAIGKFAEERR
jgi:hypothetical protein